MIVFNKPYGVLCQFTDATVPPRPTLAGYGLPPDVYPAGRLDFDSEGLLLLSDDGARIAQVSSPKFKWPKTYVVQVEGDPDDEQLRALREGVELNDGPTQPASARRLESVPRLAVAAHAADPRAQEHSRQLRRDHPARRAQPPGAAHERRSRAADAATGAHRRRPLPPRRPSPRGVAPRRELGRTMAAGMGSAARA
jgi:pseudouridine synthase